MAASAGSRRCSLPRRQHPKTASTTKMKIGRPRGSRTCFVYKLMIVSALIVEGEAIITWLFAVEVEAIITWLFAIKVM